MNLEKNPVTRDLVKRALSLEDRLLGMSFPKMKRTKQITVYHCGPAVLEALYSNLGVRTTQSALVRSIRGQTKIKNFGLSVKDLAKSAKIAGKGTFSFWKKANAKISDLDLAINKFKSPVGVEWQGIFYEFEDEDNGHYCIITKIDKHTGDLRLMDPYHVFSGVDRKFKIKTFEKRWWDSNDIKVAGSSKPRNIIDRRMMFVITPKGDSWPKKLGMVRV